MASILRLLSLAACEIDEDAEFWTEELIGCLAVELRSIGIETGVELRLGFPERDSIESDVGQLCQELSSGWDHTRLRTLLIALATTNWVPFEVRDAPILNQVCVKKRSLCGALVDNTLADVAAKRRLLDLSNSSASALMVRRVKVVAAAPVTTPVSRAAAKVISGLSASIVPTSSAGRATHRRSRTSSGPDDVDGGPSMAGRELALKTKSEGRSCGSYDVSVKTPACSYSFSD